VVAVHQRLPLSVQGKVDLAALAAHPGPAAADPDASTGQPQAAGTPSLPGVPGGLADIWTRFATAPPAGVQDDLFDAGGDSLAALRLVYEVNERFGTEIVIGEFMADPTLAGLLRYIGHAAAGDSR
jgi:aryl carrier-like protein